MTRPTISGIFNRRRLLWLLGVAILVNEIFFVPPASFRLAVLLIGALLAGVPGIELARALWAGGNTPPESPLPPPTSSPPPSLPDTHSGGR